MKKFFTSLGVTLLFGAYLVYQRTQTVSSTNNAAMLAINNSAPTPNAAQGNGQNNNLPSNNPAPGWNKNSSPAAGNSTPPPTPDPSPSPKFKNGVYTGIAADAIYGNLQVRASVSGGKLTQIQFLQFPNDRSHSIEINQYALPILRSEAITNQSAQVDVVTGATDSSSAFIQSLQSALSQAA